MNQTGGEWQQVLEALECADPEAFPGARPHRVRQVLRTATRKFADPGPIDARIETLLSSDQPLRILELGSAEGVLTSRLARAGHHVSALDPNLENVLVARLALSAAGLTERASVDQSPLDRLDGMPAGFDVVISDRSLIYFDLELVVEQVARILAPGGRLMLVINGAGNYLEATTDAIARRDTGPARERLEGLFRSSLHDIGLGARRTSRPRIPTPEQLAALLEAYGMSADFAVARKFLGFPARVAMQATAGPDLHPGSAVATKQVWSLLQAGAPRLAGRRLAASRRRVAAAARSAVLIKQGLAAEAEPAGHHLTPEGVPLVAMRWYDLGESRSALAAIPPDRRSAPAAALLVAAVLIDLGDLDEAIQHIDDTLDDHPTYLPLHYALAYLEAGRNNWNGLARAWSGFLRVVRHTQEDLGAACNAHLARLANVTVGSDHAVSARGASSDQETTTVTVRPFPYPYQAMLAISSDIDQSTRARFREIHRFLNTDEETLIGPGLGLDIADSFWFYGPGSGGDEDAADFVLFRGMRGDARSAVADEIAHYLRCGWIDTIHSYGNFSGTAPADHCTRQHAEYALAALRDLGLRLGIWVNHGNTDNVQNIGNAEYMEGDRQGAACYHADLLRDAGVTYFWDAGGSAEFGRRSQLKPVRMNDGADCWHFSRFYTLPYDRAIARGLLPAVADQLRRRRRYAVLWHPPHLHVQLSTGLLDELVASGGMAVVAQHFGAVPRGVAFGGPAAACLRQLADYQHRGLILVARTQRLLDFNLARDFVRYRVITGADGATTIDIQGIDDPVGGFAPAALESLRGITFYAPEPERTRLCIDGNPVPESMTERYPHDGAAPSIGISWHERDATDYSREFADPPVKASLPRSGTPDQIADLALGFLATQGDAVPAGIDPSAYAYALNYTVGRYRGFETAVRRFRAMGFSGLRRGLDVGSGAGHWCMAFLTENNSVSGIDSHGEFVELAARVADHLGYGDRVDFQVARAQSLPFEPDSFDVAWSHSVLQFADTEQALSQVARVLKRRALFYNGYSTLGFRLSAILWPLMADNLTGAQTQVRALLGTVMHRHGFFSNPWSAMRAPTLEDSLTIADAYGMRFVDLPQLQDDDRTFLGFPETIDYLVLKERDPQETVQGLAERPNDAGLRAALERLTEAGAPRLVVETIRAREGGAEEAGLGRLLLVALVKSGVGEAAELDALASAEADPLLSGMVCQSRRDHAAAHRHYMAAGEADPRARFLAATALIADGRTQEAENVLQECVTREAVEVDCQIALMQVAALRNDLGAVKRQYALLLRALGRRQGNLDDAEELIGRLDATASGAAAVGGPTADAAERRAGAAQPG